MDQQGKSCSICGAMKRAAEFTYGNRANRSYCRECNKAEMAVRVKGGIEAARQFRERERAKWQPTLSKG